MKKVLQFIAALVVFALAGTLNLVLIILGFFLDPFVTDHAMHPIWGNRPTGLPPAWYRIGQWEWLRGYAWRAWRNPANNVQYWLSAPKVDTTGMADPDYNTYQLGISGSRFILDRVFFEYWYARPVGKKGTAVLKFIHSLKFWNKNEFSKQYFEVRIGWKYAGKQVPSPTFQFRLGG
jgi:hypothetical protein